jgi:hypothetical protein
VIADVQSARLEWEDARRELDTALRDPARADALAAQLDVVLWELRKRMGSTYTLRELGAEYRRSEAWVREAVGEHAAAPGWPLTLAMVEGAAFHVMSLGAVDYEP